MDLLYFLSLILFLYFLLPPPSTLLSLLPRASAIWVLQVFVSTRKAAQSSATTLAKEARLIRDGAHKQLLTTVANGLRDNKLRGTVRDGVGSSCQQRLTQICSIRAEYYGNTDCNWFLDY